MSLPEILVIDTQENNSILLREASDELLNPHLPPSAATLAHLPVGAAQTAAAMRQEISTEDGGLWGIFPVIEGAPAELPIGVVGILVEAGRRVTSTVLFNPDVTGGKGYGTAAKIGVMAVDYAAGVRTFSANIADDNEASKRSATKVGLVQLPPEFSTPSVYPTGPDRVAITWNQWLAVSPDIDPGSTPELTDLIAQSHAAYLLTRKRYQVEQL